ncbi:MAG TPA: dockerin type I domain-containing protein [Candidatus Paceibacterota bacterium]|nr:dockerin type I domain-containing protein [Candidatus Paceibacterota bacterium]
MLRTWYTPLLFLGLFLSMPFFAQAAQLKRASDLISNSAPGVPAVHEVTFTTTNSIPAGGAVTIRFDGTTPFVFGSGFDYTNVDFAVATSGDYSSYIMDAAADTATSTAELLALGDGAVRVHLASDPAFAVPSGAHVRLRIGAGATANAIVNSTTLGPQRYTITTHNVFSAPIDTAIGLLSINAPISLGAIGKGSAATLTNGLPKGLIPGGTKKVMLSFSSNLPAYCRYSMTPGVAYDDMPILSRFKSVNFNRDHSLIIDTEDDKNYTYYIRCFTKYGLTANEDDFVISFDVGVVPKEHRLPPPPPGTQEGDHTGGGNSLPQSGLYISGRTFPGGSVRILKDGKEFRTMGADGQGNFSTTESSLDRGTYGFNIASTDSSGLRSATYSITLYLNAQTQNNIGPVYLSPTITAPSSRIEPGSPVVVSGLAIPSNVVQVVVLTEQDPMQMPLVIATTTANSSGGWSLKLPTENLRKGTYSLRAQSLIPGQGNSLFSNEFLLGVGEKPQGNMKKRADVNGDGKVNLADLSILLFNWKKSAPQADVNSDGTVNITDFSIMLSAWTG